MRRLALLAGTALALAGCSTFPELDAQITDQARGADYLSLKPLDTVTAAPDPVLEDSAATGAALETAGLALQARGATVAALDPGLIDTARSQQEHAERLIAESALARLQLQDSAVAGTSAETPAQAAPEADATALATAPDPAPTRRRPIPPRFRPHRRASGPDRHAQGRKPRRAPPASAATRERARRHLNAAALHRPR
ncbi:MAG: hypothetical protein ACE368_13495 [Paracoccaceae bacterium]